MNYNSERLHSPFVGVIISPYSPFAKQALYCAVVTKKKLMDSYRKETIAPLLMFPAFRRLKKFSRIQIWMKQKQKKSFPPVRWKPR